MVLIKYFLWYVHGSYHRLALTSPLFLPRSSINISLELFCFVNLTSSCSLIPLKCPRYCLRSAFDRSVVLTMELQWQVWIYISKSMFFCHGLALTSPWFLPQTCIDKSMVLVTDLYWQVHGSCRKFALTGPRYVPWNYCDKSGFTSTSP